MSVQYLIVGNFANQSLSLLQWVINRGLTGVVFAVVDTGWACPDWQRRIRQGMEYAQHQGIAVKKLHSTASFEQLVRQQNQFPSVKFQWCAGLLKGVVLNQYLDEVDPGCEATVLLAKRRCDSRRNRLLLEHVAASEHYNGRALWHPIIDIDEIEMDALISQTGLEKMSHRSRECEPCIHASTLDLQRMRQASVARLSRLECEMGQTMFHREITQLLHSRQEEVAKLGNAGLESMDMGCGSVWGCGE